MVHQPMPEPGVKTNLPVVTVILPRESGAAAEFGAGG
jgi:hypothetical protein